LFKIGHSISTKGTNSETGTGLDYLKNINGRKTSTNANELDCTKLNKTGLGGLDTLKLFNEKFEDLIVASAGPRYLGYVIGGATPASIIGDWLATIYDQNPQKINAQGDISMLIEKETINLIVNLFNLPVDFMGGWWWYRCYHVKFYLPCSCTAMGWKIIRKRFG